MGWSDALSAIALMILCTRFAYGAEPPPISWEGFKDLIPVLLVACLGGLVSFISKVRSGDARPFNFTELIGELLISGFAGTMAFWLCHGFDINPYVTAFLVGISGHMGGRGIFMFEKWAEEKLQDLKLVK